MFDVTVPEARPKAEFLRMIAVLVILTGAVIGCVGDGSCTGEGSCSGEIVVPIPAGE